MHCDKMVIKSFFCRCRSAVFIFGEYENSQNKLPYDIMNTMKLLQFEDEFMFCIFAKTHNLVGLCVLPLP